jgi:hypothetical protein
MFGTKWKHGAAEVQMLQPLKSILGRTAPTFFEDLVGCFALCVILYMGLTLPGLV